jgi:ATP-binding cassette subfamily B protein
MTIFLAILVFVWCVIFFIIGYKMTLKLSKLSQKIHETKHKAIGMVADNITNIFTIFSFTSRRRELKKIKNFTCKDVANLDYQTMFYDFKFACVGALLFIGMSSSVLIYAGYLRYINEISVGGFAYVITILYKIIYDIWTLSEQAGNFFNKLGDFKSSFSIMQIPHCKIDKDDAMELII